MFLSKTVKTSLDTYRENLENFQKKFNIFENLNVGEKIGKNEQQKQTDEEDNSVKNQICGEYCVYEEGFFQKFYRWWNNENYEKTFNYLDKDFSIFMKYLDNIKNFKEKQYFIENKFILDELIKDIIKFNNKIIYGLYNLKSTYKDITKIKAKIDSIILTLIDFNTEVIVLKKTISI